MRPARDGSLSPSSWNRARRLCSRGMVDDERGFLDSVEHALGGASPCEAVLGLLAARLATESGTIHRLDTRGLLCLEASVGIPAPVLPVIREIPIGKGMAGLAVERRAPVTACNLQTDTTGDVRPGARATGLQGSIVVPILAGGEPVGALGVANQRERTFTPQETELLLDVGRRLAAHLWRTDRAPAAGY
jgi:L-methionine (R)-S-oxide reductase